MRQLAARLAEAPRGVSSVEFARLSGVGRATIHRLATGRTETTLATLRELAILHGYDLEVELVPLSDAAAASALRQMVDPAFATLELPGGADGDEIRRWMERLERYENIDDAAIAAAHASSLLHRKGAVYLRGDNSAKRLASAGEAAGTEWAISGAAALEVVTSVLIEGPSVLWVDGDPSGVVPLLADTHRQVSSAAAANVIVARAHPSVMVDRYADGPLRYVAPTQLLLDCIGLGGELEATALLVRLGWSEAGVV